jgi:Fe-S-cluster containining protein
MVECSMVMQIGDQVVDAKVRLPGGPVRVQDLLPVFYGVTNAVVSVAEDSVKAAGQEISCRAGCGACCRQPVPISQSEARFIANVVAAMPEERRDHVLRRFAEVQARLEATGDWQNAREFQQLGSEAARVEFGLKYFHADIPCPFLEDESCSIHQQRPAACREYLVTTPAENCKTPGPENIRMVGLPRKPSLVLYRFEDCVGGDTPRYLLLSTALDWVARHMDTPQATLPGPKLMENFLRKVSE